MGVLPFESPEIRPDLPAATINGAAKSPRIAN